MRITKVIPAFYLQVRDTFLPPDGFWVTTPIMVREISHDLCIPDPGMNTYDRCKARTRFEGYVVEKFESYGFWIPSTQLVAVVEDYLADWEKELIEAAKKKEVE